LKNKFSNHSNASLARRCASSKSERHIRNLYDFERNVITMRTIFYGVVEEEKKRNLERQQIYQEEIGTLPRGYLNVKKTKGIEYYYLQRRNGQRFVSTYIGNDIQKVDEIKKQIAKRKHYEELIKKLKLEYKQMCKVVKE
jgi:hypothetical protein